MEQDRRVADLEVSCLVLGLMPVCRSCSLACFLASDSPTVLGVTQAKLQQAQSSAEQWQALLRELAPGRPGEALDVSALGEKP